MFKRFTILLLLLFVLSILVLTFTWSTKPGLETYSTTPLSTVFRISQDLGGKWNSYASLKQAWAREQTLEDKVFITGIKQPESVVIPSSQGLPVIAKQFRVQGSWVSRTAHLVLEGVYGEARVYLNGIDQINYIGELTGMGGSHRLEIAPGRFNFDRENTLYIEFVPRTVQPLKLGGWFWPEQGRITGQVRLEAVPETTLDTSQLSYTYQKSTSQLIVSVILNHHQDFDKEPWVIRGTLKDNGQPIAECLLPVHSNGHYTQSVDLVFNVPNPKLWSIEDPNLYDLQLSVINSRGNMDNVQVPVGISQVSVNAGKWTMQDESINVKGRIITQQDDYQIRHSQMMDDWLMENKAQGINLIYFMGFFPDQSWLYALDRLGLGAWLELPVVMIPSQRMPEPSTYEKLVKIQLRHPSVMAWTVGQGLQPSAKSEKYLQKVGQMVNDRAVFHLHYFSGQEIQAGEVGSLYLSQSGLEGAWGEVRFYQEPLLTADDQTPLWGQEKNAAVVWIIWLIFITFQNLRAFNIQYSDLVKPSPKRAVREAFFWRCLLLVTHKGMLAGIITAFWYRLSFDLSPWLPYCVELFQTIQHFNPFLIWLFITVSLVMWRLMQVGIAVSAFTGSPSTLGLACFLEKRNYWVVIVGLTWIMTFYWIPVYIPLVVYVVLALIMFPLRVRDVWQAKGRYLGLLLLPFTLLAVLLAVIIWHWDDAQYVWQMFIPLWVQALSEINITEWLQSLLNWG